MQNFSKVLGVALASLSIGYAAMPVGREIDADEPVVLPHGVSTYFAAVAGGGTPDYKASSSSSRLKFLTSRALLTIGIPKDGLRHSFRLTDPVRPSFTSQATALTTRKMAISILQGF